MDRPILFSAPMVRALLAGRKKQTRRVLSDQPIDGARFAGIEKDGQALFVKGCLYGKQRIPYATGDRLYVREAWRVTRNRDNVAPRDLTPRTMTTFFEAGGSMGGVDALPRNRPRSAAEYVPDAYYPPFGVRPEWVGRLRQGMHMPRWASRLTLTVTDVRVQRLQDISEADAIAEGLERDLDGDADDQGRCIVTERYRAADYLPWLRDPIEAYADLWDQLNDARGFGWDVNPWVVAVSVSVEHSNIDAVAP